MLAGLFNRKKAKSLNNSLGTALTATKRQVLVISKEAILKTAKESIYPVDRLRRDLETYNKWVLDRLPKYIDKLVAGGTVCLYSGVGNDGLSHWIDNKPIRLKFAEAVFEVGVYCYFADDNEEMDSCSSLTMRLRASGENTFKPRVMDNPLCPNHPSR